MYFVELILMALGVSMLVRLAVDVIRFVLDARREAKLEAEAARRMEGARAAYVRRIEQSTIEQLRERRRQELGL